MNIVKQAYYHNFLVSDLFKKNVGMVLTVPVFLPF